MRIAILTATFPPYRAGMGQVALDDAEQLAALGHEVHVFTPQRGAAQAAAGAAFAVHELRAWARFGNAALVPAAGGLAGRFDLTLLHYPFFGGAECVWLGRLLGGRGRLLLTYHMDVVGIGWLRRLFAVHTRFVMPRIVRSAERVLVTTLDYAQSGDLAALAAERPDRFTEMPLAVDVGRFAPGEPDERLRAKLGLAAGDRVILFVGALDDGHYFKGLSGLLAALAMPGLAAAKLVVVGKGNMLAGYEDEAARLGVADRVRFAGFVSDGDLPKHHRLADVFAFPSVDKSEAFGIAALEALASGVPVVASDLAGVRTIVRDGVTGRLVPPGDVPALAAALAETLGDAALRRRLGDAARRMAVEEYSATARQRRWAGVLASL
jgi:glycosyltransferase involved in cell wall biosynthesis